jgi:hypothetical protein
MLLKELFDRSGEFKVIQHAVNALNEKTQQIVSFTGV